MGSSRGRRSDRPSLRVEHLEDRLTPSTPQYDPRLPLAGQIADGAIAGDRVTVVLNHGVSSATLSSAPFATAVKPLGFDMYSVHLAAGTKLDSAIAYYKTKPGVVSSEPDPIVREQVIPNDPSYSSQYGLAQIGAPSVWNLTTGNSNFVVGVIDTGIDYTHPELYQNMWLNQAEIPASRMQNLVDVYNDGRISFRDLNNPINWGPFKIEPGPDGRVTAQQILAPMQVDALGNDTGFGGWSYAGNTQDGNTAYPNDFIGWNFVSNTNDPFDDNEHGTHVSGTIGAQGNNGIGVSGVNWSVSLMALKFLDSGGGGFTSDAVAAINYSVTMGVKLTNNSWGGGGPSFALQQALGLAQSAGDIFVAAAGNNISNNDLYPFYPAYYSTTFNNVVTVAATNETNSLAAFSNYGATSVTLAAPGVDVLSTVPGYSYKYLNGTSMATPHVTGALALYWGANTSLNYAQVIDKLKSSVDQVSELNGLVSTGGRLNVANMFGLSPKLPTVVGAPAGTETVRVLGVDGATQLTLDPYPGFLGGVVAAAGDLTGTGTTEVVTAATIGGHVKVFDGTTGAELSSFYAFEGYQGPISVAVGDLTGSGIGDIIVAANLNGHVKVFDGATGALIYSALLYPGYFGAVSVAVADLDGSGRNVLITGADGGAGVHVKEFNAGTMAMRNSFLATGPNQFTGFSISAGDLDGDGMAELLISQGPRVRVLDGQTNAVRADFLAFDPLSKNRVTVQAARYLGDSHAEVVAIGAAQGQSTVNVFTGPDFALADSLVAGTR